MNPRNLVKAGALAVCLAVCGSLATGCSSPAADQMPVSVDVSPSTGGSPQQQAAAMERTLVAAFASIRGAHVAQPATVENDQTSETWKLDSMADSAFAAAVARLPRWPATSVDNGSGGQHGEIVQSNGSGALGEETVSITVTPDGAKASTLRVTAQVEYRLSKPKAEHVLDSGILVATLQPVTKAVSGSASSRTITARATIARIAADINALPTVAFGPVYNCPAIPVSTTLTLDFESAANAPASASSIVRVPIAPTGFCTPGVQVTVDGANEPELDDSADTGFFTQIEHLAGFAN